VPFLTGGPLRNFVLHPLVLDPRHQIAPSCSPRRVYPLYFWDFSSAFLPPLSLPSLRTAYDRTLSTPLSSHGSADTSLLSPLLCPFACRALPSLRAVCYSRPWSAVLGFDRSSGDFAPKLRVFPPSSLRVLSFVIEIGTRSMLLFLHPPHVPSWFPNLSSLWAIPPLAAPHPLFGRIWLFNVPISSPSGLFLTGRFRATCSARLDARIFPRSDFSCFLFSFLSWLPPSGIPCDSVV